MSSTKSRLHSSDGQWEWDGTHWVRAASPEPPPKAPSPSPSAPGSRWWSGPNPWTAPLQIAVIVVVALTGLYAAVTNLVGPSHQQAQMLAADGALGSRGLLNVAVAGFPLVALGGFLAGLSVCVAAVLIAGAIARRRWAYAMVISGAGVLTVFSVEGAVYLIPLMRPYSAASFAPVYPLLALIWANVALWIWMIVAARRARRQVASGNSGSVGARTARPTNRR